MTSEIQVLIQKVAAFIQRQAMAVAGERWLVAVSGGADSMALLYILVELRDMLGLSGLHVGHLNHQLRGAASEADAAFVADQAGRLGLPVTCGSVDVAGEVRPGESIEMAARRVRYRFLLETAVREGCQRVALGHHADDQVETILQRMIRGTGWRGLAGIPAMRRADEYAGEGERPWLVRPLLEVSRAEIEVFLWERGIVWRQDDTNSDPQFTRNRIRHHILPMLRRGGHRQVDEALGQLGRAAREYVDILADMGREDVRRILVEEGEGVSIRVALLRDLPRMQQAEVIHQAMTRLGVPLREVGFKHVAAILELIGADGGAVALPGGYEFRREGETLGLRRVAVAGGADEFEPVALRTSGQTDIHGSVVGYDGKAGRVWEIGGMEVRLAEGGMAEVAKDKSCWQEGVDADRVVGRLVLRTWWAGDRFGPLGAGGEKTLGDFFTDAKVPVRWRRRIGLVCDEAGIVWVVGLRIAERVKLTGATRRRLELRAVLSGSD